MNTAIVLGLGAMGSAAAQHLAEAGWQVTGFDSYQPPHLLGSSHGRARIIRQCYFEDPRYVPLLLRTYELWRRLEVDAGTQLMHLIGGLSVGSATGTLVTGSRQSAEQFGLAHEMFATSELRRRYPQFTVEDETVGFLEKNAGFLLPEDCITAQLRVAAHAGADLHLDEPVVDWSATGHGVSVRTSRGTYSADRLVLTAGAWAPQLLKDLQLPLQVTRQVVYWFQPGTNADVFRSANLPIFLCEGKPGERMLYGFPTIGRDDEGVKVGLHGSDQICTPENVERSILPADEASIRIRLQRSMPGLNGSLSHAEVCLYTMTPDENFIVDVHPHFPQVALACGFSGHGFKFAAVMGEVLADLAMGVAPLNDVGLFGLNRFDARPEQ